LCKVEKDTIKSLSILAFISQHFPHYFESEESKVIGVIVKDILLTSDMDNTISEGENWVDLGDTSTLCRARALVLQILSYRQLASYVDASLGLPIYKLYRKILVNEGKLSSDEYHLGCLLIQVQPLRVLT